MKETKIKIKNEQGKKRSITITDQDIIDVMKTLEPEKPGVGDTYYHGFYAIHPETKEHYGIKRVMSRIIKSKGYKEITITADERTILNKLGFTCGVDQVVYEKYVPRKAKTLPTK